MRMVTHLRLSTTHYITFYLIPSIIYLPELQFSFPMFFSSFPLFRSIFIRERIQIVHGHQFTSMIAHEAMRHARTMVTCLYTLMTSLLVYAEMGYRIYYKRVIKEAFVCIHNTQFLFYKRYCVHSVINGLCRVGFIYT